MARIRAPPPIGYKGPFKTMEDVYKDYRNTLMNRGLYRPYFIRSAYQASQKYKQHAGEHSPVSEPAWKEHQSEIQPTKTTETEIKAEKKNEQSQKIETTQEKETSQKIENKNESSESQNELSYEKLGLPYEKNLGQTDIRQRNRPSQYYDKAETRW